MEIPIPLHADHSKIVKFESRNAQGYQFALDKLRAFVVDAPTVVSERFMIRKMKHSVDDTSVYPGIVQPVREIRLSRFTVPFDRDPRFVGRKGIIQELNIRLKTQHRVALSGIGGIG